MNKEILINAGVTMFVVLTTLVIYDKVVKPYIG